VAAGREWTKHLPYSQGRGVDPEVEGLRGPPPTVRQPATAARGKALMEVMLYEILLLIPVVIVSAIPQALSMLNRPGFVGGSNS
jgi:hypothetical protein